ncbi:transcription initiation factor TFIID subunit 12 [Nematocida homosporus]|uniref:transcription initiation factor TFIID subunit 12 n=1 Tax=Nematocida homosporus TaxID=1912981 RepID=UPI00221E4BE6|nr:transcription initiation factor TFIID subunit 12 [Nematocida homosporus]KAI5185904.1 transcription initiation factor TFIID subunit 12 [Nematocida homosporus]
MGSEEQQNLHKRIQHLQNMLGEINRYLQSSTTKPPAMVSRLLEEKARITSQLRELNNTYTHKAEEANRFGRSLSSLYNVARKTDKVRDMLYADSGGQDPLDTRVEIEEILKEMGVDTEIDSQIKKILLSSADIFIDNLIATACSVARNREASEVTKEDIIFAMKMERGTELYSTYRPKKAREPDKEHLKRLQMIKKDQKKSSVQSK